MALPAPAVSGSFAAVNAMARSPINAATGDVGAFALCAMVGVP